MWWMLGSTRTSQKEKSNFWNHWVFSVPWISFSVKRLIRKSLKKRCWISKNHISPWSLMLRKKKKKVKLRWHRLPKRRSSKVKLINSILRCSKTKLQKVRLNILHLFHFSFPCYIFLCLTRPPFKYSKHRITLTWLLGMVQRNKNVLCGFNSFNIKVAIVFHIKQID